jgi:hypothetical protein
LRNQLRALGAFNYNWQQKIKFNLDFLTFTRNQSMKTFLSKICTAVFGMIFAVAALAQTYPSTNPTYVPNAILPATTYISTGVTTAYQTNSTVTLNVGIYGTFTGLAAVVQGTESRGSNPTWQNLPIDSSDGDRYKQITGTGLYRVNTSGLAQVRVNIISLTSGSVSVGFSGGMGPLVSGTYNINKHTYSATVTGLVPAASATDFLTIQPGAASGAIAAPTVRVTHVECSGQASSSGSKLIQLQPRLTLDTGGTSSVVSAVPHDSTDPTATAIVTSFTANPTVGTATSGVVRAAILNLPASTAVGTPPLAWDFGSTSRTNTKEIDLNTASQVLAIHGAGASFPAGTTLNCTMEWIEE